jgi:hypothetical protein
MVGGATVIAIYYQTKRLPRKPFDKFLEGQEGLGHAGATPKLSYY